MAATKSRSNLNWAEQLARWFRTEQRAMPWRDTPSEYTTWISEMMLQQTQVDTVIPFFLRFVEQFPSVHDLAAADLQKVLKAWEGLGYYSRAKNLHKAANLVVNEYGGKLPQSYEELQKIPGIGPYIAAAITSIAFEHPVPVVDGNVLRVFTRFWNIEDDIRQAKVRDALFNRLTPILETISKKKVALPSEFNQAIMELGALICKPTSPKCSKCPISSSCMALEMDKVAQLPFKSKKAPVPHHHIGVGVIWRDDKLLIAKRPENKMLGGLWEFPGGKQTETESILETVVRECKEEVNLDVQIDKQYCVVKHTYSHFKISLHAFKCSVLGGKEKANCSDELRWITLDELDEYPFPKANVRVLEAIKEQQASPQLHL
jgi:A/G-specific adenine glycosylase